MWWENWTTWLRDVPRNPDAVFDPFAKEMVSRLGDDLCTVAVYGSAASGDYVFGKSNINMALLLKTVSVSHLKQIAVPVEKWTGRGFATPLILTRKDLERSLDVYPLLFMEIKDNHRIIYGEEFFNTLSIDKSLLRVQVEMMLKTKVAEARTEFLASGESLKTFEAMIARSFTSLVPLLRGLLFLSGLVPSIRKDVVVALAEEKFGLELGVLSDGLRHRMGFIRLSEKHHLLAYYERYMVAIEKLADLADTMVV